MVIQLTTLSLLKLLRRDTTSRVGRRLLTIFTVMLTTGLRANELCQLELQDIHLESQFLIVRQGKGQKQRMVPLRPYCSKIMWRWIHQWREEYMPLTNHLIVTSKGQGLTSDNLEKMCRRTLAKVQVKGGTHILRHTFATLCVQSKTYDLERLRLILGHSSLIITQRYVHLSNHDLLPNGTSPFDKLGL